MTGHIMIMDYLTFLFFCMCTVQFLSSTPMIVMLSMLDKTQLAARSDIRIHFNIQVGILDYMSPHTTAPISSLCHCISARLLCLLSH